MSASASELPSMEDNCAVKDKKESLLNVPFSAPPTSIPSATPSFPSTTRPNFTSEAVIESKAVSVASNDCRSALSSPAEASPAKPAATSTICKDTAQTSPPTSCIASASDSLKCTGTSLINISESSPLSVLPLAKFGGLDPEKDFPTVLTFKGVSVSLENNSVWKQFYSCGTEMIVNKTGRRMFPYCRYRLTGLDPDRQYSLVLSIVPLDQHRYRWNSTKWEVSGAAEHQYQGLIRAFPHHYSPCRGSEWTNTLVSFYKLKLTNNFQEQDGHIILHSMHRYIPRLHVIPVPDGDVPTDDKPVVMGPESITFTFPQTEFMAVTTYQNFRITQLKINHNPFARGFREDGGNPRLQRAREPQPVEKMYLWPSFLKPAEPSEIKEEVLDLSTKNHNVSTSLSNAQETRLVLKPIMSNPAGKDEPYVRCIRGKHALGELVLVEKRPRVEPEEEDNAISITPEVQQGSKVLTSKASPVTPASSTSTPTSSPGNRKRRKRISRRWANSQEREWKAVAASSTVIRTPSFNVSMQPELDDVEGLLFASFTSKEALEIHVKDKPASNSSPASPVLPTTLKQSTQIMEVNPETDEEKITRLEPVLLNDLRVLKHRQVIHPVLQEVGLKLSSLDPCKSIDLSYLGVRLPLPPPNLPEQTFLSTGDEGLPFISRTGKTSDVTKIKGWKNKFSRSKPTSPSNCEGLQKNLSAFCSNMLDEYLESEAQQISERAAAFSTNPEGSVAYQLPAKSSSYVKTLDSALKHRNAASKSPVGTNRPCPLSHKPLLYSALTSPPPLASPSLPGAASGSSYTGDVSQRVTTSQPGASQKPVWVFGLKSLGPPKFNLKLLQIENGALNQGLNRTHLTADRLSAALSVMLTKQTPPNQVLKVAPFPKKEGAGPECGQDHCRLGCVCSSLQHLNKGPLHCRRSECMFSCACFKRKITKQITVGKTEQETHPVYSMTNMDHEVQPHPGSHAHKLWNRNIHDEDPEPLFTPKYSPLGLVPPEIQKCNSAPHSTQLIEKEEKDPVYQYLESMMTCARVREVNSKPPRQVSIEPKIIYIPTPNTPTKPQITNSPQKNDHSNVPSVTQTAEKTSQETVFNEKGAKKQIQIQSMCTWQEDHKMVLEALFQRVNQNRLSKRFDVGPYCISPVDKIFMRKPSGSIVTYRVQIHKQLDGSDYDEDEFDDSGEEKKQDDGQIIESEMLFGVTPFLDGVIPAGRLRARRRSAGSQVQGLVQVNGKFYSQARLLLGNIGSLHPANRVAAHVTGRLHAPEIIQKTTQKTDSTHKANTPGHLHIKAADSIVPPVITARKTTDLKTPTQPPVQLSQPDVWRKGSITRPQHSQSSSTIMPVESFVSSQSNSVNSFQSSSKSSHVSLTVSPSLKTPSFLGHSGTYSFRICPPSSQDAEGQKLPGVTLPGGFTLIQLPKNGTDGAAQQPKLLNAANKASMSDAQHRKDGTLRFSQLTAEWFGLKTLNKVKSLLSSKPEESGSESSSELICYKEQPSDGSDDTNNWQTGEQVDNVSEDLSSDLSDYSGEDEDDELVDIETVEEESQRIAIAQMKEAVLKTLEQSRDDFASRKFGVEDEMDDEYNDSKHKKRRRNHTALERLRRTEQRMLFDKLQNTLKNDCRTSRHDLLIQAIEEIQKLVKASKILEKEKKILTEVHSAYVERLSLLSGKSASQIKYKLKDICERQKIIEKTTPWKPFFSKLLQSRAALLQTTASHSNPEPSPVVEHDYITPSQVDIPTIPAHNNIRKILSLLQAHLQKFATQASGNTAFTTLPPLPQAVSSPAQAQFSTPYSQPKPQTPSDKATPQVSAAEDGTSPASSTFNHNNPQVPHMQPFTLPLIRSKSGRIILPSSLKPAGQGFYRLMVMKPKDKEVGKVSSSANVQPSDVGPLSVESDAVCHRRRRPRKDSDTRVCKNEMYTVIEETRKISENDTSTLDEEGPKRTETKAGVDSGVADDPAPVKRSRGRPSKRKSNQLKGYPAPVKRAASSLSKSKKDSPVTPRSFKSPPTTTSLGEVNSSRPLTRGALGKDFPSAKKRSWIDVEKELEPELDYE